MTAALKPCPNPECRGEDLEVQPPIAFPPGYIIHGQIRCRRCHVKGPGGDDLETVYRLWDLLPREPRWTSEPPTAPGDYLIQWWRSHDVRQVTIQDADIGLALASAWSPESQRYGPIPEPQSPAERSDRP